MKESVSLSSRLLRFRHVLLGASLLALAGLVLPLAAQAQTNFGSVAVGSSATASVTLTFTSAATLGSIAVVTQGAPNLDFTNAGGGTCSLGTAYAASATCTVSASFAPIAPGLRRGAVVLSDGSGNVLATTMAYGNGTGPLVTFPPGAQTTVGSGFHQPKGVAVDAAGNIFVANSFASVEYPAGVYEVVAAGGYTTVRALTSGFIDAFGVAVDGSGDVFFTACNVSCPIAVYEILAVDGSIPVSPTIKAVGSGFSGPMGVALDGAGNLFVADHGAGAIYEILAAGGYTTVNSLDGGDVGRPFIVSVDGNANLFVGFSDGLAEFLASSGYTTSNSLTANLSPEGIALDAAENVYVAVNAYNGATFNGVVEIPSESGYSTSKALAAGFNGPDGIALDANGNIYVSDSDRSVVKLNIANPPSLTFATPTKVGSADTTDGVQTATVSNIGNEPLIFTAPVTGSNPSYPAGFPVGASGSGICTSNTPLAAGASCDVSVLFVPTEGGADTGTVVLTDNSLNQTDAVQSIALSGTGTGAPTITWALPAAITYGTALSATQLDASASVAGTLAYSPAAGTVLPAGSNTLTVKFTPMDTTDYISATATVQLTVNQASQTITFPALASQTKGTDTSLSASSTSGLTVGFASLTPSVCTVSGAWASFVGTGPCTIQASQAGGVNYLAATTVSQTFSVAGSTESTHQTITFAPIATQVAATTLNLSATSSSGLAVSFQSTSPSVCTVSGTTASLIAYGFCTIQAWQGGNSTYYAAPLVSQQFGVAHASQTVSFPTIATQAAATTLNLAATASSGLPVTFTSTTPSVCTISGSSAALVAYGTCDITASQAGINALGSSEYFAASLTRKFSVAHASQTVTFPFIPDQVVGANVALSATASSGLPVGFQSETPSVCTVSGATASMVAQGICIIQTSQAGNNEYLGAAPVREKFSVTQAH